MTTSRAISLALVAIGLIGLVVAVPAMARRLHARETPQVWFQEPVRGQQFTFRGEPVTITVAEGDADTLPALEITFRGRTLSFPIEPGMRNDPRLPGLDRFGDWLSVIPMVTGASTEAEVRRRLAEGDLTPRLLVAVRRPAEGFDPDTWGLVRRKEWRYTFALLDVDAPVESCIEMVDETYSDLDKLGDPEYRRAEGREDELWKFQAMLQVTPPAAYRSKNRPLAGAMAAMGWTWPVAGLSVLALTFGAAGLALSAREAAT